MRNAHQYEFIQAQDYLIQSIQEIDLPCEMCGEKNLLSRYCNKHRSVRLEMNNQVNHICHLCNASYADKRILQAHLNIQHGKQIHNDPNFECYICKQCCDQIYLGREDFQAHMSQVHDKTLMDNLNECVVKSLTQIVFSCKYCQEPCLFSGFCRKHDANVNIDNCSEHPESHSCEPCNVMYTDCNDLWIHMFSQHIDETLYCNLCEHSKLVVIKSPSNLMKHWKRSHKTDRFDEELRAKSEILLDGETKFLCSECSCIFSDFIILRDHYKEKHGCERYYCNDCGKYFKGKKSLGDHRRKIHGIHIKSRTNSNLKAMCRRMKDEGVCYECPHCGCTLKRFFSLKEHMLCVHARNEEKKHVCSMCGAAFALARRLRNHYACVHTAQIKVTVQPQSSSSDHRLVKSEVQILEGDRIKYKCPLCDRIYTSFSETKRHFEVHSGERKYTCSICSKCFFIKNRLSEHYRRVHKMRVSMARTNDVKKSAEISVDGVTKYKCHICDSIFTRYDSLRLHVRTHTGDRPYTCDVCGKSFVAKKHLNRHYNCSHAGFGYQCNICGRVMSDSTNFKDHLDNHKGEKKYTCEICGTGFMYKSSLHHHKFSHSKERMFQCSFCEKKYMSPKTLKEHEQTHRSGDIKHICDTCGSEFNTRKNMLRHTKVHSTERPYICEYCNVSFKEKKSLVRHYKIHKGVNTNTLPSNVKLVAI
ncbi:zinc finger protein 883-like isoform X1 [Diaphorina citri]|uniref:Zinc finger protein 883-like isoform X1 n=2 Tax=Diaphorina citri TaxID=121845 RepID=A0A3Q0IXT4_DIACI|nr:zinc finger protein 883-like isoform X1 [Diaphorina citri]